MKTMSNKKYLKLTLVRSMSKRIETHKACVKGLGLRRLNQTVSVEDTQENRGMINKVAYLLRIEEN
jgi:large subunit ribosomal protein L30